jgi:hypothetical protein
MSDIKSLLISNAGFSLLPSQIEALMGAGLTMEIYKNDSSPNKNANIACIFARAKENGYTNERIVANTLVYMLTKPQIIIDYTGKEIIIAESKIQNIATFISLIPSYMLPVVFSFWKWWTVLSTVKK